MGIRSRDLAPAYIFPTELAYFGGIWHVLACRDVGSWYSVVKVRRLVVGAWWLVRVGVSVGLLVLS